MPKLFIPNYDDAVAFTGGVTLPAGGYICKVAGKPKIETWSSGNGASLVIPIDIVEGEHKGHYQSKYDNNPNSDKKWGGLLRQSIPSDGNEKSAGYFKGMMDAFEKSNHGFVWNNDDDTDKLNGKLIGIVFSQEEYIDNNGEIKVSTKPNRAYGVDYIRSGNFTVPELKKVNGAPNMRSSHQSNSDAFDALLNGDNDDLPFL